MSKTYAALLVLPCFAWLAMAAPADPISNKGDKEAKGGLKLPAVIKGKLDDNDKQDPVRNQPAKIHDVRLVAGKTYVIDMISDDFDSFLRLEDAQDKNLAEDDDGGEDMNSQIIFTPEKTGDFKVVATRFEDGSGAYTLRIDELKYKVGKAQAVPAAGLAIKGSLDNTDAIDPLGSKRQHKVYSVKLEAGKTYTIDLTSGDFDSFLRLADSRFKILATDDDSGGNLDARIVFRATEAATYHIVVTTLDGELGDFNLQVKEENAKPDV